MIEAGKEKANKLITLLSDSSAVTKMRKDGQFNFDQLNKSVNKVSISDCQNLFDYAKLLFETQDYERAHHYLFILKEILGTQTNTHYDLVSQVFWGLLACEIQLRKSRESTELTTIRKIKDMVRTRFAESPMGMLH
jgi:hypothetical protein